MRDRNLDSYNFCKNVETSVLRLVSRDLNDLRSDVIAISNFQSESSLPIYRLGNLGKKDFIRLSIFSWYVPREIGVTLRLELEERLRYFAPEDRIVLNQFLKSKANMLIFLQETSLWHSRDFFGNILGKNNNLDRFFRSKFFSLNKRVRYSQRKRGYDDHGSRVEDHRKLPKYDWSLTELQNEIERNREIYQNTEDFLQGFIGG